MLVPTKYVAPTVGFDPVLMPTAVFAIGPHPELTQHVKLRE
jgi:hypothetical protein